MNIDARTRLTGVIGFPVSHSLSPIMHNSAYEILGLNYCYLPLPLYPDALAQGIAGLRAMDFAGFNVTIPYKEQVMPLLDRIDLAAKKMGAVNTVVKEDGLLVGYNTDGRGFLQSIGESWDYYPTGQEVVVLGAGGAARGIVVALATAGATKISVANRNRDRAEKMLHELELPGCEVAVVELVGADLDASLEKASLVVQTSPLGMYPDCGAQPIIDPNRLYPHNLVYDIIFNPAETRFLAGARAVGCRTANGMGMLLWQGALAFELWTKQAAPVEWMRQALRQGCGGE